MGRCITRPLPPPPYTHTHTHALCLVLFWCVRAFLVVLCISTVHLRRQLRQETYNSSSSSSKQQQADKCTRAFTLSCCCCCSLSYNILLALWPTALCADGAFEACLKGSQRTHIIKKCVWATRTKVMKSRSTQYIESTC